MAFLSAFMKHEREGVPTFLTFKAPPAATGKVLAAYFIRPNGDVVCSTNTGQIPCRQAEFWCFEKGHDKVADVKPDMIETDHAVADIQHLLHTAHNANAVGALDPDHTTAPQDMTKVQLPHHHGDFHFA
jgi:hypothetical protein